MGNYLTDVVAECNQFDETIFTPLPPTLAKLFLPTGPNSWQHFGYVDKLLFRCLIQEKHLRPFGVGCETETDAAGSSEIYLHAGNDVSAIRYATLLSEALEKLVKDKETFEKFTWLTAERDQILPVHAYPVELAVPRPIARCFGFATLGVHLIPWSRTPAGTQFWTLRSQSSTISSLSTAVRSLATPVADFVQSYEDPREAVYRGMKAWKLISGSRAVGNMLDRLRFVGEVSFCDTDHLGLPDDGRPGTPAPSTRLVYSIEVDSSIFSPGLGGPDSGAGSFRLLDVRDVKKTLLAKLWDPTSGLAMLHYLIEEGFLTEDHESDLRNIKKQMKRKLPVRTTYEKEWYGC